MNKLQLIILLAFQHVFEYSANVETIIGNYSATISQAASVLSSDVVSKNSMKICISVSSNLKENQENVVHEIMIKNRENIFEVQTKTFDHIYTCQTSNFFNIFIVNNHTSLKDIFEVMRHSKVDYNGKFLVVILELIDITQITIILNDFWSINIINVNVLVKTQRDENESQLYTYLPFSKDACSLVHPILWKTFKDGVFHGPGELYPNKVENLNDCLLAAAAFDAPPFIKVNKENNGSYTFHGMDIEIMTIATQLMKFRTNFTVLTDLIRWGAVYANGTSRGAIKMV